MAMYLMVLFIFTGVLHISEQFTIHVTECPNTAEKWKARSALFTCVDGEYHCIQDINGSLIETCMISFLIHRGEDGCPWIYIKDDGSPIIGFPMHNCCTDTPDCPNKNHEEYRSNEIYKYPNCILPKTVKDIPSSTTSPGNVESVRSENRNLKIALYTCVGLLVLLLLFGIIGIYILKRRKYRDLNSTSLGLNPVQRKNSDSSINRLSFTSVLLRKTERNPKIAVQSLSYRLTDSSDSSLIATQVQYRLSDPSSKKLPLASVQQRISDPSSNKLPLNSHRISDSSISPLNGTRLPDRTSDSSTTRFALTPFSQWDTDRDISLYD